MKTYQPYIDGRFVTPQTTTAIDVVDPAFAPGTGTPEAGGPSSAQALELIRGLHGIDFIGFDVMEVIPSYDPGGVTATLAANLAFEMMSLSAIRRGGRA